MTKHAVFTAVVTVAVTSGVPVAAMAVSAPLSSANPENGSGAWLSEKPTNQTWGWAFTVNEPLIVTDVGWYDEGGNGLSHSHRIGLWTDPGRPLTPVQLLGTFPPLLTEGIVIPSGTVAQLDGPWRKMPIPTGPFTLPIGNYILGGENNANSTDHIKYGYGPEYAQLDPRVSAPFGEFSSASGFTYPNSSLLLRSVEFGPMLFVVAVPEPGTCTIAVIALAIVPRLRLKRAHNNPPSAH